MGRDPRDYQPDGIYHLTTHGVDERPIFRDDVDRQGFAIRLRRVAVGRGLRLYAVCLMDTHHHLIVQPSGGDVGDAMRVVNGGHSRAFNVRHGRRGALFEARYTCTVIKDEEHLEAAVRYVEGNAVLSGAVPAIEDWPWATWAGSPLRTLLKGCLTP